MFPRAIDGQGTQLASPQGSTSVQKLNFLRKRLGRMRRPGLPQTDQPPHPPTISGHRLGWDWGHQVSTGMHHREQCPAEASFPDPTEKEHCPPTPALSLLVLVSIIVCLSLCITHTHTHSLRLNDPQRHTPSYEPTQVPPSPLLTHVLMQRTFFSFPVTHKTA